MHTYIYPSINIKYGYIYITYMKKTIELDHVSKINWRNRKYIKDHIGLTLK